LSVNAGVADMTFNEGVDTWFDSVVTHPRPPIGNVYACRAVARLDDISQLRATKHNFNKFTEAVETLRALAQVPWADKLYDFVERIRQGKFRSEFRFTASRHRAQCSQVSELFSLFQQAFHYNR